MLCGYPLALPFPSCGDVAVIEVCRHTATGPVVGGTLRFLDAVNVEWVLTWRSEAGWKRAEKKYLFLTRGCDAP